MMKLLRRIYREKGGQYLYWLFIAFSPAFIVSYSLPQITFQSSLYLVFLALLALNVRSFHSKKSNLILVISLILYGASIYLHPITLSALPFFIYSSDLIKTPKQLSPIFSRALPLIFSIFAMVGLAIGIDWSVYDAALFIKPLGFYACFFLLLLLASIPLFFIHFELAQAFFYGVGFVFIFSLVGFGYDWGYCLTFFCTSLFITLIGRARSIIFKSSASRISLLVVMLYSLLWSIPTPFMGLPGLGVYGAIYRYYPAMETGDPLKHPFWREAGERYQNVQVGISRNGLPPNSAKLEFLLKRSGVKGIEFLDAANSGLKERPSDFNTFYILDDWRFSPQIRFSPDISVDLLARIDGYLVYAPGWKACKNCREIAKNLQIEALPSKTVVGQLISFGETHSGVQLLGNGWSKPEAWGVWSEAQVATVFFPKPEQNAKKLTLDLRAFISPAHLDQIMTVLVDGKVSGTYRFDKGEGNIIDITLPASPDNFYKITFELKNPIRPVDLGFNKDKRLLGIGLVSARFER